MKPTVLVDLDGVLAKYTGWLGIEHIGEPLPGAVQFTRELTQSARVVIYTTRCKELLDGPPDPDRRSKEELVALVRAWLDKHGFAYDEIYSGQGKPFAVAIIDDRAVACTPQTCSSAFMRALGHTLALCEKQESISKVLPEQEGG